MIVLVNFANDLFKEKQAYQNETALNIGGIDKIFSFNPSDIDEEFYEINKHILSQERGSGYWLWKPYFIKRVLETLKDDDLLLYLDSGAYFIESIDSLVDLQKSINQDIIPFYTTHIEKIWTKRDTLILMNCDNESYLSSNQNLGTVNLWIKSRMTLNFLNEWITYGSDERCISDISNTLGIENYKGFKENRHDQSIFSLLCKKYNLQSFPDPTQFGNKERSRLQDNRLQQIFHHTKADKKKKTFFHRIKLLINKLKEDS